jgi:hypothetical protein
MRNVTIAFLTVHSFLRSPFLTLQPSSFPRSFLCDRSRFARFAHPFLVSSSFPTRLFRTSFSHFLSHPLCFSSVQQVRNEVFNSRQTYSHSDVEIESCQFVKSREGGSGGALVTSTPTKLRNCYFEKCEATYGGAIASTANLVLTFVTFTSCRGRASGCVDTRNAPEPELVINNTLFNKPRAELFGAIFRISKGGFWLRDANFSRPQVDSCVGAIESKYGSLDMRFTVIANSRAHRHNGAICLRHLDELTCDSCMFANCSHVPEEFEAAGVLLAYENAYDSAIVNSVFLWNRPNASWTIHILSGHQLTISKCYFSGDAASELGPRLIVRDNVTFGHAASIEFSFSAGTFHQKKKAATPTRRSQATTPENTEVAPRVTVSMVIASCLFAVAVASIFTLVLMIVKQLCECSRPKRNKAAKALF